MAKKPEQRQETSALYVRLPKAEAEKLDRAAYELRARKRDLVAGLVARYVDPSTPAGLDELRSLNTRQTEVPPPPEREPRPRTPSREPVLGVSAASNWVAGIQREIQEFAKSRRCAHPLVRVALEDGQEHFVRAISTGPGEDYVHLSIYPLQDGMPRALIVRLDVVKKVELLQEAPNKRESEFVFQPRKTGVGFSPGD
jgi:hypothetical protein